MMANPQSATSEPQSQNQSAMPTPVLEVSHISML